MGGTDKRDGTARTLSIEGSVVRSVSQSTWPFTRAECRVGDDEVVVWRQVPAWRHTRAEPPLRVTCYRVPPFLIRTVLWLEPGDPRRGFLAMRPGRLLRALADRSWPVDVHTVTWRPSTWPGYWSPPEGKGAGADG